MNITLLVESFVGLVSILGILIFFLFYAPNKKRKLKLKEEQRVKKETRQPSLKSLVNIIKDKKSTTQELKSALDLIIDLYGTIEDFDIYGEVLIRICKHPNTTKDLILNFNKDLEHKNKNFTIEINDFIAIGLNSRQ